MTAPDAGPRVLAGRYELLSLLGRGGGGEVWRGVDTRLGRDVAIKLVRMPPGLGGDDQAETRRRVMREARAAARIRHPAAVTMYDVLDVDGELCLVMELVEAPDLGRLVEQSGPLAPAAAARIGLDLLDVLETAHGRGLVHRDVKPSNVLVPEGGPARLTDFGTAVIAGEDRLTASGMVFGSPAYMAPEQAVDADVGPPADLWSLGATLYQAVEGHPPFSGPTAVATMYAVMHEQPRPATRAGAMQHVIDRLLVRDPAARATGTEVRELLQAVEGQRTAMLPAAAAAGSVASGPAGSVASAPAASVASAPAPASRGPAEAAGAGPPVADHDDAGWGRPRRSHARRGRRGRPIALLAAGAMVALVGAVALTSLAEDDGANPDEAAEVAPASQPATPSVDAAASNLPATPAASTPAAAPAPAADGEAAEASGGGQAQPDDGDADQGDADQGDAEDEAEDDAEDDEGQGQAGQGQGNGEDEGDDDGQGGGNGQGAANGQGAGGGGAAVAALPAADVPADWVEYRPEEAPYRVAHPPDWTIERLDATRTDIDDPSSSAYLRLDWTDDPAPDALADWQAYEPQFAEGREGYERIRMEPTTFKGEDAALWEYRYRRNGTTFHAYNLNVSGGDYGYALNYQTTEQEWAGMEPVFGSFAQSYEIRG